MTYPENIDDDAPDGIGEVRWAPRVPRWKIRRLYENDAQGLVDEELIDDVGIGLLLRCRSIMTVHEAAEGRIACPRCARIIARLDRSVEIVCPDCAWRTTWPAYLKTYQDKQLHGGGAIPAFAAYAEEYERARTAKERLLLIDRVLHAFHCELARLFTRPAACNLIGGKLPEVMALLDGLTYGDRTTPAMRDEYEAWVGKAIHAPWIRDLLEKGRERSRGPRDGD